MKCRTLTLISAISLLAALALPVEVAAQHTRYKLIDIGALGGPVSYIAGNETGHRQLNNRGIVAGTADISTPDPNAGNPDLCLNPDCFFLSHAFLWQNGVLTDLGTLPGGNDSSANVINARGWIAGGSTTGEIDPLTGGPVFHAVLWKNEIIDLGTLGGNESGSNYVNNEGQVVGTSTINTVLGPQTHPFLWENGVMLDLGTLGGPDAFPGNGCANQRKSLVVGGSNTSSTPDPTTGLLPSDPFLWENGTMLDLTARQIGCAHNLAGIVDPDCSRVISSQAAQVLHHSMFPKKSVATWPSDLLRARPWVICQTRSANDLTSVVRAYRCSIASEAAEVDHGAVLPKERVIGE